MTQDPTKDHPDYGRIRGGAQWAAEPFEEETELDDAAIDPSIDLESNELKVEDGRVCVRCKQPIEAGLDVRRTGSGDYEHEVCPFHMPAQP